MQQKSRQKERPLWEVNTTHLTLRVCVDAVRMCVHTSTPNVSSPTSKVASISRHRRCVTVPMFIFRRLRQRLVLFISVVL
jgi:hypothetical protein